MSTDVTNIVSRLDALLVALNPDKPLDKAGTVITVAAVPALETGKPTPEEKAGKDGKQGKDDKAGKAADRLGPYPSREAAEHALETVQQRNESADKWDDD